ncbi:MAG: amino acid adenylation domain-containing protein, partial [Solobacterium sp.]|nr:amino acid adenylation domain-containing protein [Solobacterium sp.]
QEGMYFHNELDSQDASYHLQSFYRTNIRVDESCLKTSLTCLADKYDVFKTAFAAAKATGTVKQIVLETREIELKIEKINKKFDDALVKEYSAQDLKRGFNLKDDSLMRVAVLSFLDVDVLFIGTHHIIIDGWSNPLIVNDLARFYNLCRSGKSEADLRTLAAEEKRKILSFGEYVKWIQDMDKEEVKKFWDEYLSDYDSVAELSPMEKVEDTPENQGVEEEITLDQEMTDRLSSLAKTCDATLSTVAQVAFGILLQKHCGTDDVLFGNVVSGRNVPLKGIENAVGLFINTVPLRVHAENKDETVESLIRRVQISNNESNSFDHASLGEMSVGGRNVSEYLKHLFVFENYPETDDETSSAEELVLDSLFAREQTNFDLGLSSFVMGGKLVFRFDCNVKDYSANNIRILKSHLETIVKQMAEDSSAKICDMTVMYEKERDVILHGFNDTNAAYPSDKTIVEMFEEQVEKTPDNIAVVYEDTSLTYAELNAKANQLAHILREKHGVKPDDFVAIVAERSLEMIVGIYGIIKAGGAYVPVDPTYPEDRVAYMLEDAAPKAVLTYHGTVNTDIPVIDLSDSSVFNGSTENLPRVNQPEDIVYCIYTSGTTGKPKGVPNRNRGLINRITWMHGRYPLEETDTILQKTTFTFDVSVWEIIWWSLVGAKVIMLKPGSEKSPEDIRNAIGKYGVTHMHFVPSMLNMFLLDLEFNGGAEKLTSLKYVFASGEALSTDHLKSFNNLIRSKNPTTRLINFYGPTEASIDVTYFDCEYDYTILPIGKPINNTQIHIVQGDTLCGIGIPGELCIAGDGLARGYLNRPELTAEKFVKNPYGEGRMYHTGDLARWMPDGNIDYLGRIDDQVKIRGFRIELGEIESRIREIDKVKDCAVIARPDVSGEKAIFAYYVSDEEIRITTIREELAKSVPDYMVPAYMMQIDSIPVTKNGKLDRRALPEIEAGTGEEYVAPRNETEEIICRLFSEILNVEKVSVKDSFFALGGHSLRATRLVNRIEAETGVRIALKTVFSYPTPAKLAEQITGSPVEEYIPIPIAEEKEYYPMSSAQKRTFLICQMDPDGILYNMPQSLHLTGEVRPEAMKEAIQKLIDRHEILRTQFLMVDGEPMQKILDHVEADFEYVRDAETPEEKLISDFVRPFDLSRLPLVRVRLVDRDTYHLLSIDIHHIVGDGMSMDTFTREMSVLYNGEELEPLTHQFKDYSEWMQTRDLSSQAEYWKGQFEDEIPVLDMPLDFTRPQEQNFSGSMVYKATGNELGEKVKKLAARTGSTEFMVFMSAAMVLLSKYSRQEDIVIGTPISGRTHKDTEGMLGMFINTLAMRGKPEGKKTYLEFLGEMKDTCLKAYENQEYPFEDLVEAVDVVRDMSRTPLFDVMLVLQNNEDVEFNLNGVKAEYAETEDTVAKFDLTFNIYENGEGFGIGLEYCKALFTEESAKGILDHLVSVLGKLTESPEAKLETIEAADEREEQQICVDFNDTKAAYPNDKTVVELFEEQVEKTPDNIAVVYEDESLTYAELNAKANQVA